jgi:hypothetical protein
MSGGRDRSSHHGDGPHLPILRRPATLGDQFARDALSGACSPVAPDPQWAPHRARCPAWEPPACVVKVPEGAGPREWQAVVGSRVLKGTGCPFCAGARFSVTNSLAARFPKLARQLHPTKNGGVTPGDIWAQNRDHVWWKCPEGPDHEWRTKILGRAWKDSRCPFCAGRRVSVTNSLAAKSPKLARQWHPTRNGRLTPHDILAGSGKPAWWKCPIGHVWQSSPRDRRHSTTSCPICRTLKRRSTVVRHIARQVRLPSYEGSAARGRARG